MKRTILPTDEAEPAEPSAFEASLSRTVHAGLTLDVSIRLGRECGVVFGASGAGKSTLLRLIAGIERPDEGVISVDDTPWFDASAQLDLPMRSRRVGMIFQDDLLFPHLNVEANIRFGLHRESRIDAARRVREVTELCGVGHLLPRDPSTLSGGERQRVGLARALAPRPRLLLCDEPVSAIDLDGRFALVDRLKEIQRSERIPLLYVTHSPAEAIALGDTLFLLKDGKIADRGAPLDVLARRPIGGPNARLDDVRNLLRGVVVGHSDDRSETIVQLHDGPILVVPRHDREPGSPVTIAVRADDILLARGPVAGLSARNVIAAKVERVVPHEGDAEVVLRAGSTPWIVSVVGSAVDALALTPGVDAHLILKARSCHVL